MHALMFLLKDKGKPLLLSLIF